MIPDCVLGRDFLGSTDIQVTVGSGEVKIIRLEPLVNIPENLILSIDADSNPEHELVDGKLDIRDDHLEEDFDVKISWNDDQPLSHRPKRLCIAEKLEVEEMSDNLLAGKNKKKRNSGYDSDLVRKKEENQIMLTTCVNEKRNKEVQKNSIWYNQKCMLRSNFLNNYFNFNFS